MNALKISRVPVGSVGSGVRAPRVWCVDLAASGDPPHLLAILSEEERARAARFHFPRDRQRFLVAHAALRAILAVSLRCLPQAVPITSGPHGKPEVAAPGPPLFFSLSHSGDLALLAVSRRHEVGIDVEQIRVVPEALAIARVHFPQAEAEALAALPGIERAEAFLAAWTRHEALLKGLGLGLIGPTPDPLPEGWSVHDLHPAPGYRAALAFGGRQ